MRMGTVLRLERLRQIAVEQASRQLADCIGAEAAARDAVRRQGAAMTEETRRITEVDAIDPAVEAFGAWLRRARRTLRDLSARAESAAAETARARAELSRARAALEAVGEARERLAAEMAAEEERKDRLRTEEMVGVRYATAGRGEMAR